MFKNKLGFTLVELIMVLALGSIVIGLSLPSFKNLFQANNDELVLVQLLQAAEFSRQEALMNDQSVIMHVEKSAVEIIKNDKIIRRLKLPHVTGSLQWRKRGERNPKSSINIKFTSNDSEDATIWLAQKSKIKWSLIINTEGRVRIIK